MYFCNSTSERSFIWFSPNISIVGGLTKVQTNTNDNFYFFLRIVTQEVLDFNVAQKVFRKGKFPDVLVVPVLSNTTYPVLL
jgi:hypothetical protein